MFVWLLMLRINRYLPHAVLILKNPKALEQASLRKSKENLSNFLFQDLTHSTKLDLQSRFFSPQG